MNERKQLYRCGWCGHPTDEHGEPLKPADPAAGWSDAEKARYDEASKHVDGKCCPYGSEGWRI